jgi:hypothetical protein
MHPPVYWTTLLSSKKPDPARHVHIEQKTQSIKGSYSISPFAKDAYPPLYDMPTEEATTDNTSSATFETKDSAVAVRVWVIGKSDEEGEQLVRPPKEHGKPVGADPLPVDSHNIPILGHFTFEQRRTLAMSLSTSRPPFLVYFDGLVKVDISNCPTRFRHDIHQLESSTNIVVWERLHQRLGWCARKREATLPS